MPPAEKEGTIIVLDVGVSSNGPSKNEGISFLEQAKSCISKILQRKIFAKPKDEVGLVLMGTNQTRNNLNETLGGYEFISEAFEMGISNWNMLRVMETEIRLDVKEGDWLDAIIVSMDILKRMSEIRKFTSLKIVLLSTLATQVNSDSIENVIGGIQDMNIELVVINDNVVDEEFDDDDDDDDDEAGKHDHGMMFTQNRKLTQQQMDSEKLILKIVEETNGVLSNFENAIVKLMYFSKKKIKGMPWNAVLSIGTEINIKISSYIFITDDKSLKWETESSLPNTKVKTTTETYKGGEKVEVNFDDVIYGYMYGSSPIPIDSNFAENKNTTPGLMCIGFTKDKNILDEYFTDTGTSIVVTQKASPVSEKMLNALIVSMLKSKVVMIARKVYRRGTQPSLYVLIPKMHNNEFPCFSMIKLTYAEELRYFNFPSLKCQKTEPTPEQYDAIDKLIESMDLMTAIDDESGSHEAFAYKKTLNPSNQYIYRCITQRALHPRDPLQPPDQELLDLLSIPKKLKEQAKPHIDNIKNIFKLEELEKPKYNYKFQIDLQNKNAPIVPIVDDDENQRNIVEIGTVSPVEDFIYLFARGEKFSSLCIELQKVINDLMFKSMTLQYDKIKMSMLYYREEAKQRGAHYYNNWITDFKNDIFSRGKAELWEIIIVTEKLGLITADESDTTVITTEEGNAFYLAKVNTIVENRAVGDDEDIDDLLDDM